MVARSEAERRQQHHAGAGLVLVTNRSLSCRERLVRNKTVTQNLRMGIDAEPNPEIPALGTAGRSRRWMTETNHPSQRVPCDRVIRAAWRRGGSTPDFDSDKRTLRPLRTTVVAGLVGVGGRRFNRLGSDGYWGAVADRCWGYCGGRYSYWGARPRRLEGPEDMIIKFRECEEIMRLQDETDIGVTVGSPGTELEFAL